MNSCARDVVEVFGAHGYVTLPLMNKKATAAGIIAALRKLAARLPEWATVVLYYGGHGRDGMLSPNGPEVSISDVLQAVCCPKEQQMLLCVLLDSCRGYEDPHPGEPPTEPPTQPTPSPALPALHHGYVP